MIKAWKIVDEEDNHVSLLTCPLNVKLNPLGLIKQETGFFLTADDMQKLWDAAREEGFCAASGSMFGESKERTDLKDYLTSIGIEAEEK